MSDKSSTGSSTGIGIGAALAIVISYGRYHSIGWAILHGICGWGYIAYCLWYDIR